MILEKKFRIFGKFSDFAMKGFGWKACILRSRSDCSDIRWFTVTESSWRSFFCSGCISYGDRASLNFIADEEDDDELADAPPPKKRGRIQKKTTLDVTAATAEQTTTAAATKKGNKSCANAPSTSDGGSAEEKLPKRKGKKPAVQVDKEGKHVLYTCRLTYLNTAASKQRRRKAVSMFSELSCFVQYRSRRIAVLHDKNFVVDDDEASTSVASTKTVIMKGKAPVDEACPIASTVHVYSDGEEVWDVTLNQTAIDRNNNKFYIIQLLESDNKKQYTVFLRWGRVGARGQHSLMDCGPDLEDAQRNFRDK